MTALSIVQKGKIAADIGAGTGFISEGLIQAGLQVIAVDQSEAILKEMKRKFADIETIDYRVGQAQNLPIPNVSSSSTSRTALRMRRGCAAHHRAVPLTHIFHRPAPGPVQRIPCQKNMRRGGGPRRQSLPTPASRFIVTYSKTSRSWQKGRG